MAVRNCGTCKYWRGLSVEKYGVQRRVCRSLKSRNARVVMDPTGVCDRHDPADALLPTFIEEKTPQQEAEAREQMRKLMDDYIAQRRGQAS